MQAGCFFGKSLRSSLCIPAGCRRLASTVLFFPFSGLKHPRFQRGKYFFAPGPIVNVATQRVLAAPSAGTKRNTCHQLGASVRTLWQAALLREVTCLYETMPQSGLGAGAPFRGLAMVYHPIGNVSFGRGWRDLKPRFGVRFSVVSFEFLHSITSTGQVSGQLRASPEG